MAVNYAAYQQTVNPLEMAMRGANMAQAAQSMEMNKLKIDEYNKALQKKDAFDTAIQGLGDNPTPAEYARLIAQFPEMSTAIKSSYDLQSDAKKASDIDLNTRIFSAFETGNNQVALSMLDREILAAENSGDSSRADAMKSLKMIAEMDPDSARKTAGLSLAAAMGPDQFAETYQKINKAQIESKLAGPQFDKAQSDAQKAAIDSQFAETNAVIAANAAGIDVSHLIKDPEIQKQNKKIAAATRAAEKAKTEQEQEKRMLDIEKLKTEREVAVQTKRDETLKGVTAIDQLLNNANEILELGQAEAGLFGQRRAIDVATGTLESRFPTVASQAAADFETALESLDAQIFLAQVPLMKGMGQLTEMEGKRLTQSLRSLSLRQSAERLEENIRTIQELMLKARSNAEKSGIDFNRIYQPQLNATTTVTVGGKSFSLVPTP